MNITKIGKQALTSTVVASTILWSMSASLLVGTLTAKAAVADGTLIKAREVEAVYYYVGGKRYTFPNLKTYKTWYKDFLGVQIVPLSELQTYQLAGNIVYRPGTRLVKITTDPKVYAAEPGGKLRWVKDEATAKALYGTNWAKLVDDVPDAFFTNYTIGSDITSAVYPDGALISNGGKYYYMEAGKKRLVDSAALSGNNFNTAYAIAVADVSTYADGTAVGVSEFSNTAQGASVGQSTPTASGSLTIATASDTPSAGSIVADATSNTGGQRRAKMLKMSLTANGGDAMVTEMKTKRLGVSKDADVDYVYILDANGKVLAKNNSISLGVASFVNSTGLFTVPAGQTVSVYLANDVNSSAAAGSTQGWSVDAADIKLSGGGVATGSASGSLFTVAAVTDLGQLGVSTSTPVTATTVDAGKVGHTLNTFKINAIDQEILVKDIKFTQIGTISAGDLKNLKLMIGGIQFDGTKAQLESNNTISFDLTKDANGATNADVGLKILSGQTKFVDITGDVVGGTNRTFAFSIQNQEDVTVLDNNYKVYVGANTANSGTTTNAFSIQTHANTTVNTGKLTISIATDSPNTNVASSGTNITFAKFSLVAAGENVKVTSLGHYMTGSDTTDLIKNVKVYLDGVQVGSTSSSLKACGSSCVNTLTFSNNFVVQVGKPSVLTITGDLTDSTIASGSTYSASLSTGSANAQGVVSLSSINTATVSGYTLTAKTGVPTVSANAALYNATATQPSGVLNDLAVKIGSFSINAGAGEGAKITSIQLGDYAGALDGLVNNMRIEKDGKALAAVQGTLSAASSTYTFNLTETVSIAKGQSYVFDVVADVLSTTSTSAINANPYPIVRVPNNGITYQTLETAQSGTISTGTTGQNVFIAKSGQLGAAIASDTPSTQQFVMGATNVTLAKFRLTASTTEDIKVSELTPSIYLSISPNGSAALANVRLMDGDKVLGTASVVNTGGNVTTTAVVAGHSASYAKFSSLDLVVPKNAPKTVSLVADISSVPNTLSSSSLRVYLTNDYDTGATASSTALVATGAKSGQTVTVKGYNSTNLIDGGPSGTAIKGGFMTLFRTKISIANASNAPTGASSASTEQAIARFVVSNAANVNNAQAKVDLMNVRIDTTISVGQGATRNFQIYKVAAGSNEEWTAANKVGATSNLNNIGDTDKNGECIVGARTSGANAYSFSACPPYDMDSSVWTAVTIEPNSYVTFVVTFDTSDASSNKTLTAVLPTSSVVWEDGQTTYIPFVDGLPLNGKTLSY